MAVGGWTVTFGRGRRGLGWAAALTGPGPPRCTKNVIAQPPTASVPITVIAA